MIIIDDEYMQDLDSDIEEINKMLEDLYEEEFYIDASLYLKKQNKNDS